MNIKATIDIASMPEEVFSWIDNPDKALRWQKGVRTAEIIKYLQSLRHFSRSTEVSEFLCF